MIAKSNLIGELGTVSSCVTTGVGSGDETRGHPVGLCSRLAVIEGGLPIEACDMATDTLCYYEALLEIAECLQLQQNCG